MQTIKNAETIVQKYYLDIINALNEAEKTYNADRRKTKNREIYQWCAAEEMAVCNLAHLLDIDLSEVIF
jgi:hypothetical protein